MEVKEHTQITLTESILMRGSTSASGAWSHEQLRTLGVPIPMPKNWKASVIGRSYPKTTVDKFLALSKREKTAEKQAKTVTFADLKLALAACLGDGEVSQSVAEQIWSRC